MGEIKMPVCPYCGAEMQPISMEDGNGWAFDFWECHCIDIPRETDPTEEDDTPTDASDCICKGPRSNPANCPKCCREDEE